MLDKPRTIVYAYQQHLGVKVPPINLNNINEMYYLIGQYLFLLDVSKKALDKS